MLVLSRKPQETIKAGDITVSIVKIERGRVKLGIIAPDNVNIVRGKLAADGNGNGRHHENARDCVLNPR